MNSIQTQKFEKEGIFLDLFNKTSIILIQKQGRDVKRKTVHQYSPMKIDGKILKNIVLQSNSAQHKKGRSMATKKDLYSRNVSLVYQSHINQHN